jgi:NitT/TauT family transport system ATP-binding protein
MATLLPPQPLIEVKGLNHFYGPPPGGHLVLEDVDLTLYQNEVVGLLGRSGSGKSTLLRSIAGLIHPREGTVARRQRGLPRSQRGDGVPDLCPVPWLTVLQNVELGLEAQKVPAEERRSRALAAIDLIGLDGFENAYPKEFRRDAPARRPGPRAGGQSLAAADGRAFSALDVLTAETLRTDLLDLWSEGRMPIKSILIVTHNIEEAVQMCDRILVFSSNPGRVVAEIKVDIRARATVSIRRSALWSMTSMPA